MNQEIRNALLEGELAGERYSFSLQKNTATGFSGMNPGLKAGYSIDFKDYRSYIPGDDLRHIDWNVYARTDKLIIKLYREEVAPHVDIIIDASRSMALENTQKMQAHTGLAALFACAARNTRWTHCVWNAANDLQRMPSGNESPSCWNLIDFSTGANPAEALIQGAPWRRQGVRILISDLLWPGDSMAVLRRLSEGASTLIVIQLLAGLDIEPPREGSISLVDIETDEVMELRVDSIARESYRNAFINHQNKWAYDARHVGAFFCPMRAEELINGWSMQKLQEAGILGVA